VIDAFRHEAAVALLIQHGADVRAKDDKLKARPHPHPFAQRIGGPAHPNPPSPPKRQIPLAYAKDAQISKLLQGAAFSRSVGQSVQASGSLTASVGVGGNRRDARGGQAIAGAFGGFGDIQGRACHEQPKRRRSAKYALPAPSPVSLAFASFFLVVVFALFL
jgi:hypothetical protein